VKVEPLKHKLQCTLREIAMHDTALDADRDLVIAVHGMEMRRRMLPREDADHDAKESGYLRHRNILLLVCPLINGITSAISGGYQPSVGLLCCMHVRWHIPDVISGFFQHF
jgi:hypothetical protein